MRTRDVALSAVSGALYAIVGVYTYFGITFYGVRFWPAVVIPGIFAALYGGLVGGTGAAIGIFISDVMTHGNAFLSIAVGVPANFLCFYLIGFLCQKLRLKEIMSMKKGRAVLTWIMISSTGLALGSMIIGIGLTIWSQQFPMPFQHEVHPISIETGLLIALWTFVSEFLFLWLLVPPVLEVVRRAA
jgi:hypothetical protein